MTEFQRKESSKTVRTENAAADQRSAACISGSVPTLAALDRETKQSRTDWQMPDGLLGPVKKIVDESQIWKYGLRYANGFPFRDGSSGAVTDHREDE
jgi:hypothetical protein